MTTIGQDTKYCKTCGAILSELEIKYLEHTCNKCELQAHAAFQEAEFKDRQHPAPTAHDMNINQLAARQFYWVERMGWHNKTELEALALIGSEVGEAVNECRGEEPTEHFGEELADIILRTLDLAHWKGIDLCAAIEAKMLKNEERGTRGRRV